MVKQLHSTMSEILNEHKRTYDKDSMRNLTDVYLKQIQESRDPNFNGKQKNRRNHLITKHFGISYMSYTNVTQYGIFRRTADGDTHGSISGWS